MDLLIMQYNYRNKFLFVIDGDVYVYKHENVNFTKPSSLFKQKMFLLVNQKFVK